MNYSSYDGAEYRFIKDITKTWNVKITDRTDLFGTMDTWTKVIQSKLSLMIKINILHQFP